ncbi:MAG: LysR family transcriptional regulator [Cyanobium sp.]
MVSLEELAALDLHLWLRTGLHAARASGCNQSTISRRVERTLGLFQLQLQRRGGDWQLRGDPQLIRMERELHQHARFLGQESLRLEISPLMVPLLADPPPPGWSLGRGDILGLRRPLQLLRECILDAWLIDSSLDLPSSDDHEIARFDLACYPLWLAASDGHPLVGERGLTLADLQRFPVPQTPQPLFPNTSRTFAALGLAGVALRSRRYDPADWEGRTADGVTLTYATPFNLAHYPDLLQLDSEPLLTNGVSLVVRRAQRDQPALLALRAELLRRLQALQPRLPRLQLLD